MTLYTNTLADEFDDHAGRLLNYIDAQGNIIISNVHYNLRAFYGDDITVPRTMSDMEYWNVSSFDTNSMIVLDTPRSVTGRTVAARNMSAVEALTGIQIEGSQMSNLDAIIVASGNENWTVDPSIIVGKDSAERYANTIQVNLTGGTSKTATSVFSDNILQDFNVQGATYFIELALPGFPAQGAASHLDLNNSWIDFSSDPTFATKTDSFKFSDSLNSLTAGGDTYWQINRNSLVNADLSSLQAIRFRLLSVGNMTFKAQALRLYRQGFYNWPVVDIDTKRNTFRRAVPRDSGTEPAAPAPYGTSGSTVLYFNYPRPADGTHNVKFNSGHIPVSPNQNYLAIQSRRDNTANSNLEFQLISNTTNTTIKIYQRISGVLTLLNTTVGPALAAETFYYFNVDYHGATVSANIKNVTAAFYGSTFLQTPQVTTTLTNRGYVGFDFNPYNYDFYIESINASDARFASFVSKSFPAITPYTSVTLSTKETEPINLLSDTLIAAGDATVSKDPSGRGRIIPNKIVRDGTTWQGGIMSNNFSFIGNPHYTSINVDIYPFNTIQGIWRLVFLDRWDSVGWMNTIRGLLLNQWNNVNVPLNSSLASGSYRIILQQVGNYANTFWVDNFQLNHLANAWEASPDNGVTWIPFGTSINKPYSGINFKGQNTSSIKIRSSALSDTAWVAEYEALPNYGYTGRPVIKTVQITAPAPPGNNYTIPAGATVVSTQADLETAIAGSTAKDIKVLNGTYTRTGYLRVSNAAHRIWCESYNGVTFNYGFRFSTALSGWQFHGGVFNITTGTNAAELNIGDGTFNACILNGQQSGVANCTVTDITCDGANIVKNGIRIGEVGGATVQRILATNFTDSGVKVNNNVLNSANTATLVSDIDVAHVYYPTRGSNNGQNEFAVMIGNTVTGGVSRIRGRDMGWGGLWTGNACFDTIFSDIDMDNIHGNEPATGNPIGTGIYQERYTKRCIFQRFTLGPTNKNGIAQEWDNGQNTHMSLPTTLIGDNATTFELPVYDTKSYAPNGAWAAPTLRDAFTRANENPLASGWAQTSGTLVPPMKLVTNFATGSTGTPSPNNSYWTTLQQADMDASCDIAALPAVGDSIRLFVRVQQPATDNAHGYCVRLLRATSTSYELQLFRMISPGSFTALSTAFVYTTAPVVGDGIGIRVADTQLYAYTRVGGVWTQVIGPIGDSAISGAGYIAIGSDGSSAGIDNVAFNEVPALSGTTGQPGFAASGTIIVGNDTGPYYTVTYTGVTRSTPVKFTGCKFNNGGVNVALPSGTMVSIIAGGNQASTDNTYQDGIIDSNNVADLTGRGGISADEGTIRPTVLRVTFKNQDNYCIHDLTNRWRGEPPVTGSNTTLTQANNDFSGRGPTAMRIDPYLP